MRNTFLVLSDTFSLERSSIERTKYIFATFRYIFASIVFRALHEIHFCTFRYIFGLFCSTFRCEFGVRNTFLVVSVTFLLAATPNHSTKYIFDTFRYTFGWSHPRPKNEIHFWYFPTHFSRSETQPAYEIYCFFGCVSWVQPPDPCVEARNLRIVSEAHAQMVQADQVDGLRMHLFFQ